MQWCHRPFEAIGSPNSKCDRQLGSGPASESKQESYRGAPNSEGGAGATTGRLA